MVLNCMGGLEGLQTGGELVVMNPANNLKFSRFINAMVFAIFCRVEIIELRNYKAIECIRECENLSCSLRIWSLQMLPFAIVVKVTMLKLNISHIIFFFSIN